MAIVVSVAVLGAVSLLLSGLILARYRRDRRPWHLYWGVGIFLVFLTLAEESALDAGLWSQPLIRSYLVLVAVLVGVLSLGSAELSLKRRWRSLWFVYVGVTSAVCAVIGALTPISSSIMFQGVVWGLPPTDVVVSSSAVTVPSALLLIVTSAYGAVRQKRPHLLYITLGTAVISLAGSLYIVSFPATLEYAEFLGVLLLFLGFVRVPDRSDLRPRPAPA